jgi:transposase InsO family protein
MVRCIDAHKGTHGVESICTVLPIAPSTYYKHRSRESDPSRLPPRQQRDAVLKVEVARLCNENHQVYGARKVWLQLKREVCRRLMKELGLQGAVRGRTVKTTVPSIGQPCPMDRVHRPNALWVSDLTYVATWQGYVYAAFVIDTYARRIVGWGCRVH